jgi:hypothetical protein
VSDSFVVETNKMTVGVAVRVPGGFRFFYSDPQFRVLDDQIFRRARNLARTVGELARKHRSRGGHAPGERAAFV